MMEQQSSNNNSSNNGNLTHGGGRGYLARPGPITSLLPGSNELNLETGGHSSQHAPTSFTELSREQHFSFLNGGRLVVDWDIESGLAPAVEVVASQESYSNLSFSVNNLNMSGPIAGNKFGPTIELGPVGNDPSHGPCCICGRKRKRPESEGTSMNLYLNENATPADQEVDEECDCEVSPVQRNSSGSMNPQGASSSHGHANQLNQANLGRAIEIIGGDSSRGNPNIANHDENRNRNGRSTRRGTPHRNIINVPVNSSGETPRYQPPSLAEEVQRPIEALTAREASIELAVNFSTLQPAPGSDAFGSSAGLPLFSPSYEAASLSDAQGGTLGQASQGWNIPFAQRYIYIPTLQPDTNSQPGGSSTRNVAENPLFNSTGMVQQRYYQYPRLNGEQNIDQPIGIVLPGANLGNFERFGPAYLATVHRLLDLPEEDPLFVQGNQVLDILEDNNEELDDMRLDIDDMTYEDLLDLGEYIGTVNTGLSEKAILQHLKRGKYSTVKDKSPEEIESCCICLDEFANCQKLGKLDCNHNFHFDCIKQWVMQKNFCPICKRTALPPN